MNPRSIARRNFIGGILVFISAPAAFIFPSGCTKKSRSELDSQTNRKNKKMRIHYLEIVTPDIDATVELYSQLHSVTFSDPNPNFGGARTAKLDDGGLLGIREPLRETEEPIVRPYYLVDNIEEAVAAASRAGAEIAMHPMEISGFGKFAIFIQGGVEAGFWQI